MAFSHALLAATSKLKVIAAILPGPWQPALAAKQLATIDQLTNGRIAVNIVSGWFKGEFQAIGEHWLEHDERYRRSEEFIRSLRGHLESGQLHLSRRLLPLRQLQPQTETAGPSGNLSGRQFPCGAGHGGTGFGLVFHQRQQRRGDQGAGR